MVKDFGNYTLPLLPGEFFPGDTDLPRAVATWQFVLFSVPELLEGVLASGWPGWVRGTGLPEGGTNVAILFLPQTSVMSRTWAEDMRSSRSPQGEILTAKNATEPLVRGQGFGSRGPTTS